VNCLLLALLPVLGSLVPQGSKEARNAPLSLDEKLLATMPEGAWVGKAGSDLPAISSDGRAAAYLAAKDGKSSIVVGDHPGEAFDRITSFSFSPDGKTFAYAASSGEKRVVVVGDKKVGEEYDAAYNPAWAPVGSSLGFIATKDTNSFLVVDGKKGEPFERISSFLFSANGKAFAYVAFEGDPSQRDSKRWVVLGDRKSDDYMNELALSPDGRTMAYLASKDRNNYLVVGDQKIEARARWPVFSPDGKSFAYMAGKSGKQFVVVAGKKGDDFDSIQSPPIFTANGTVAYRARQSGAMFVVLGGQRGDTYEYVHLPSPAPEGNVAYAAWKGGQRFIVVGDRKWPSPAVLLKAFPGPIVFSPDGKVFAYAAAEGEIGKQFVVVGENKVEEFDRVLTTPQFSADGRKLCFGVLKGRELWWKVVDVK